MNEILVLVLILVSSQDLCLETKTKTLRNWSRLLSRPETVVLRSQDLCAGGKFSHIFEITDPYLPIHYTTFMALRLKQMELSAKTVYGPVLKTTQRSAHAQNHVSVEPWRKSFTTIVLDDHDFPLTASNFGNLTAFRAILAIFSLRMRRNGYS